LVSPSSQIAFRFSDASSGAPWLVFEYMHHGDLAEVLRANSGVFSLQREDVPPLKMVSGDAKAVL